MTDYEHSKAGNREVKEGRIRLKVRRKTYNLLSLKFDDELPTTMIRVDKSLPSVHPLCLYKDAKIRAEVIWKDEVWTAQSVELVECAPNTAAVQMAFADPALWYSLLPTPPQNDEEGEEDWEHPTHYLVRRMVARLKREEITIPRPRPPHVSRKDLQLLDEEAAKVELVELRQTGDTREDAELNVLAINWNIPSHLHQPSAHGKLTRGEYLETKKHPQVTWFVQRLLSSHQTYSSFPSSFSKVLDVGGGRGDLAVGLALQYPEIDVTIVDSNAASLIAAQTFASISGVSERIHCSERDFREFMEDYDATPTFDMVVALHACGDLSDLAVSFAVRHRLPFLVCPCCFGKISQQTVATRLAELCELPDLCRRAMHVVNSKRCQRVIGDNNYAVALEEYDRKWSSRNQVIIGYPQNKIELDAEQGFERDL